MTSVRPLSADDADALDGARRLWQAYADFLRADATHAACDVERLERESPTLPSPYSAPDGEVLLAFVDGAVAGSIAYHRHPGSPAAAPTCELKRLFVDPRYRGRGLGEQLVRSVLHRARERGYVRAQLDTAPHTMGAANALYTRLGFTPLPLQTAPGRGLLDLECSLEHLPDFS